MVKELDNLAMSTTSEKDVLNQLTSTIKQLAENDKILAEQTKTLNSGYQQKQYGQAPTGNDYESKLNPTVYFRTHRYKVVRGYNSATCTKRNGGQMGKLTRAYTM